MKKYILFVFVFSFSNFLFAQNATDFTTDDCNGVTHNLFDSLDAGNIIVIVWVMPCGPCATYASYAYSAVQDFAISHPERVDFYLVDDYANTTCGNLVNWGNSNNMPLNTTFSSSVINMNDYGSIGMPKVVVLGGSNHTVYYNKNDDQIDYSGVYSAIDLALSIPLSIDVKSLEDFRVSVYPIPTNNSLNVKYEFNNSDNLKFEIVNTLGQNLFSYSDAEIYLEKHTSKINVEGLEKGIYFLNIYYGKYKKSTRFIVSD